MKSFAKKAARSALHRFAVRYPTTASRVAEFLLSRTAPLIAVDVRKKTPEAAGIERISSIVFDHLLKSDDPSEVGRIIKDLRRKNLIGEYALMRYLRALFTERRLDRLSALIEDSKIGHPDVLLYYRARLGHYRGITILSVDELRKLLAKPMSKRLASAFDALALESAIRSEDADFALELVERIKSVSTVNASGLVRLLIKVGRSKEAADFLCKQLEPVSPAVRLYFLELCQDVLTETQLKEFELDRFEDWRSLAREVASQRRNMDGGADFQRHIIDKLLSLPIGRQDLMNIRLDQSERTKIKSMITEALREQQPFSLIRLGDGEAYVFDHPKIDGLDDALFYNDNLVREVHWWNGNADDGQRKRIADEVKDAVAHANVLGFPSIYRVIRDIDLKPDKMKLSASRSLRGLLTVLHALGREIPFDDTIFTEERCHQVLFDEETLGAFAENARKVVVISCWKKEQFSGTFLDKAAFIYIPPHTKIRDEQTAAEPGLHEVFDPINASVSAASEPGTLVLVAGGLIGKIFVRTAQRKGAVALDIGSVIDYMAGRKTRSILDAV